MLRSFFGQKLVIVALSIATTLAFATVVVPALGGPTAFSAKKKVKRGPPGPQGPAGPQGPQGTAGAPATALWAVVAGDGTLTRGSGTVGTDEKPGTNVLGLYDVNFNRDVSNCSFKVTDVSSEHIWWGEPSPSQGATRVRVVSHTAAGSAEDAPFNLAVFC
jgi:hypothetical protein